MTISFASNTGLGAGDDSWLTNLPTFSPSAPPAPSGNPITTGFMSGVHGLYGDVGSLAQAAGTAVGLPGVADWGKGIADSQEKLSHQRPDLEGSWSSLGGIGYNLAKAVPGIGAMIGAGMAVPEAAVPAWLARVGEAAPAILGGGEGMGLGFGRAVMGAGAAALPGAVAGNVGVATNQGQTPLSQEQAIASLALGAPEAALAGMFPASLASGGGAGIPAKILRGAMTGFGVNAVQSGLTTGLSQFLGDPDMPISERAKQIVDSALSGGIIGGVFGGIGGIFHNSEPAVSKPVEEVDTSTGGDADKATAFLTGSIPPGPPGTQGDLNVGEHQTASPIGPGQPASGLASMATPDLLSQLATLEAQGSGRNASQNAYHAVLSQELAARTPPGMDPGTGTLFSPEDMGSRAKPIADLRAQVVPDSASPTNPFVQNFNAANEPELVNLLGQYLTKTSPDWMKKLGADRGLKPDGTPQDFVGALNNMNAQADDLDTKRTAAAKAGDTAKFAQLNTKLARTNAAIAHVEGLVKLHNQAEQLKTPPSEMDVEGQSNLPGTGVAAPGGGPSSDPAQLNLLDPNQGEMLSTQETGIQRETQRAYQQSVLPGRPEGTLNAVDGPSLVRDLRSKLDTVDAQGGDLSKLDPGVRKLMTDMGLIDAKGQPRDLDAEYGALQAQKDALWRTAGDTRDMTKTDADRAQAAQQAGALKAPGGPIDNIEKLQDLHALADQTPPIEVPGRVRPVYAKPWTDLEKAKASQPNDPAVGKKISDIADRGQRAIETNSRTAKEASQLALNQIKGLMRKDAEDKVTKDALAEQPTKGLPDQPPPVVPPVEKAAVPTKSFDKLTKQTGPVKSEKQEKAKGGKLARLAKAEADAFTAKATAKPVAAAPEPTVSEPIKPEVRAPRVLKDLTPTPEVKDDSKSAQVDRVYGTNRVLEDKIRAAHTKLTGGKLNGISELKDLRTALPDVPHETLDKVLTKLHEEPGSGVQLARSSNPADRSAEKDVAGVAYKGELAHQLIANPRPVEEPAKPTTTVPASASPREDLQVLHDAEPEGSSQKDFMAKALASRDSAKWRSALKAVQLTKSMFTNESGSLNLGAIKRSFAKLTAKMQETVTRDAEKAQTKPTKASDMPENQPSRSPQQSDGRVKDFQALADLKTHELADRVARDPSANVAVRRSLLIAEGATEMARIAGKYLKSASAWVGLGRQKNAISSVLSKPDLLNAHSYLHAKLEERAQVDNMIGRMNDGSGLDPRKKFADHADLLHADNRDVLAAKHRQMASDWSRMQQNGTAKITNNVLGMMQSKGYQEVAASLRVMGEIAAKRGVQLAGHEVNPFESYQFRSDLHDKPLESYRFWRDATYAMHNGITEHIKTVDAAAAEIMKSGPGKAKEMLDGVSDLRAVVKAANQRLTQIAEGTYAPLSHGRGDYFVSGKIALNDAGMPKPEAMAALQKALDAAKFHGVGLFHDGASNTIMTRVGSMSLMSRLEGVFTALEKQGHLIAGETKNGHPDNPTNMTRLAPKFLQSMISHMAEGVDASPGDDAFKDAIKSRQISQLMDMLPDHSIIPNMQKREFVQGFTKDMGLAAIERAMNSSRSSVQIGMSGRTADVMRAMRNEVEAAKTNPEFMPKEKLIGSDVAREYMLREAQQAWRVPHSFVDTIRAATHTISIGANIGYTILPMSQILTLSHGELAKKYGHMKAATALAQVAGTSFKVMKAVFKGADWATVGFRESDLRAAGIPDHVIKTVMALDNGGGLSTFNQVMSDLGEGAGAHEKAIKDKLNAMGSYAEMYPRVITALAAAKLHGDKYGAKADARDASGMTKDQYVMDAVAGSQFNWGPGEASRLTGGKGPLGSFGKLAFAFTQFRTKIIMKLYSEFHDMIAGETPESRKEAGRFLASHLIATTALAGTLGLPAAGMLAGVFDRVYSSLTGDDNMDIEGLYRGWLGHVFGGGAQGKAISDVLSKGLPRALGIDLSRVGEQDLLPFTAAVAEKRKFEDATEDWINHMAGPSIKDIVEGFVGLRDMTNGDYMIGLQKALPGTLKDFAEAAYMSQHGYIDRNTGQKMPMTPSALNILEQAMGVTPTKLAQYKEAAEIRTGLMAERQYDSQNISAHMNRAFLMQDPASFQTWTHAAERFQMTHPGTQGPMLTFNRSIQRLMMGQGTSEAFGTPLGLKPFDPIRGMTQFLSSPQDK